MREIFKKTGILMMSMLLSLMLVACWGNDEDNKNNPEEPTITNYITVTGKTSQITEGNNIYLEIQLTQQPESDVIVEIKSSSDKINISKTSLTFEKTNYQVPQEVRLTAVQDDDITNHSAKIDITGNDVNPDSFSLTIVDDDTPGISVTNSNTTFSENGGSGSFDVALTTQPIGNVAITVVSNDTGEATVDNNQILFTSSDWNIPKTVNLSGVDDSITDISQIFNVSLSINTSITTDITGYNALNTTNVSVTVQDDEYRTKTIGGSSYDEAKSIAIDSNGNKYLTGSFRDAVDFDPGTGTDNHTSNGHDDIFITKLNADGSYGWTKTMGAENSDRGSKIVIDSSDNIYITGYFRGTVDFNSGVGEDIHSVGGFTYVFVTKLNSDGSYGWTKTSNAYNHQVYALPIAVDSQRNVYLTGGFRGTVDFDPGSGEDNHTSKDDYYDIFITKINANGTYGWTKTISEGADQPTVEETATAITIDSNDNIFIAGKFLLETDFNPGSGEDIHSGNVFLTKFNSNGSYGWTKSFKSLSSSGVTKMNINDLALDLNNNIYLTGSFIDSADFDPSSNEDIHIAKAGTNNPTDGFLTKINSDGSYGWTITMGDTQGDSCSSIAISTTGYIYLSGTFNWNTSSGGSSDFFASKLNLDGSYVWTKTARGYEIFPSSIAVDSNEYLFLTGSFKYTVDFNPSSEVDNITSNGNSDIFIWRYK